MKVKAKDTMHLSSVRADNIRPGETFEVSDSEGKQLIERGLVTKVAAPATGGTRKAAAPRNKQAAPPRNKAR